MSSTKKLRDSKPSKLRSVTADPRMISATKLLEQLISFKSITPSDDGGLDFISNILLNAGFEVHLERFDDTNNLYAYYKSQHPLSQNICFAGHIDVVPPGDGWSADPFKASCMDDKLYGRGAVDMKGTLACMLAAALNILSNKNDNIQHTISFLITADEEGSGTNGTKAMLEWMTQNQHTIDFAIVGEPTCERAIGDTIKIGRRGSVHYKLTVHGLQGHIAYPTLARNPNTVMVKILNDLAMLKFSDSDQYFQESHLEIVSIDTNNNISNLIPQCSVATFNVRFSNQSTVDQITYSIRSVIEKYTDDYELHCKISATPFLSQPSPITNLFSQVIEERLHIKPAYTTTGGTSDARFIQNYCPVMEFGLLSTMAHKVDEYVQIKDLQSLYDVYYCALYRILTSNLS